MSNLPVELEKSAPQKIQAAGRLKTVGLRFCLESIDICIVIIAVTHEASNLIITIMVGSDLANMARRPALLRVEGVHTARAGYECR